MLTSSENFHQQFMLEARYWMLDAGYWMLDTGYWILDVEWQRTISPLSKPVPDLIRGGTKGGVF